MIPGRWPPHLPPGLPRQSTSWRTSQKDRKFHDEFGEIFGGPHTLRPRCLTSDFRRLEMTVSRDPTFAGARKGGRSAGTSAFGRPNCSVKARREGVRDIRKPPDSLLMGEWLGICRRELFCINKRIARSVASHIRRNRHQKLPTQFELIGDYRRIL